MRDGAVRLPDRDAKRLRELHRYQILDTRRDPAFDSLCELARSVLDVPISAISFLDRDRVWFKAGSGFELADMAHSESFCRVAVQEAETLVVPDATLDARFRNHTAVQGEMGLRFYAAIPLIVRPGVAIGAICVADTRPRTLTERDLETLRLLAQAVLDRLDLHRVRIERTRENARRRAKNAEIAAQRSEIGRQRRILEQTSRLARIGGWEYDVECRRLVWSEEIFRILDLDLSFKPVFEEISSFYREDVRQAVVSEVRSALLQGRSVEMEVPVITAKGRPIWVRFLCEPEMGRHGVARLIGTVQDISEQRATEEEVSYIASHDVMTKLPNRAVFQERLDSALEPVDGSTAPCVGLMLIDIDHFKEVNDTLGHHAGDILLTEVARRLTQAADGALVARLGGDEFAILASDVSGEDGFCDLARGVMSMLVEPVPYEDESIPVTVSIGVAVGRRGDPGVQLLKDADIALYEAKGAGRNRVVVFDRTMRDELELRQSILRAIRHAVDRKELTLYYQPKVLLGSGKLIGFEALLRWRRPDGFVAGPSFFGSALEDSNLSQAIGDIVLETAVLQAAEWRRAGYDFGRIAINVSTSQFRRGDLADVILGTLARHGVPPTALMVEVTENVLLSRETDNVLTALEALAEHGISIALDDFGTGYASLTHLKEFPVDLLKIDRSFVSPLIERRDSQAIVRAITALAHDLGIEVIAEGIETQLQREMLCQLGVSRGQGYLFARPMPPAEAAAKFLAQPQLRTA